MATKILALGDSWFHYPAHISDAGDFPVADGVGSIIYFLFKKFNVPIYFDETSASEMYDGATHNVKSIDDDLGCCGEELLVMTKNGANTWLALLRKRVKIYSFNTDKFIILLSGGGNDVADTYLAQFLKEDHIAHPTENPLDLIDEEKLNTQINVHLKGAFQKIFDFICVENPDKEFHFIVHGYSYPPVNGRGVLHADNNILHNIFDALFNKLYPGPWLYPTFVHKKIIDPDNLVATRPRAEAIINDFIDRFNEMLLNLTTNYTNGTVHYVDLRTIPNGKNQDDQWCNELHFNRENYIKAAERFSEVINAIQG